MSGAGASPPTRAAPAVRVFAAFLAARAAFGLVYLAAAVGHVPLPWYYPLAHAWELTSRPRPYAMGWYGLTAVAGAAAALAGGLVFALGAHPYAARALSRRSVVLSIARAGALILLLDFTYFGWSLMRDERKPWPEPRCAEEQVATPRPGTGALRVPRTVQAFKLDGELKEPIWNASAARTGAFLDAAGGEARPYSEARFLWDAENLYVALYAADDDINAKVKTHDGPVWTDDAFVVRITPGAPGNAPTYVFDISASGVVTDARRIAGAPDDIGWESGIRLGVDHDGTLNDARDWDEEWVVEAAIPFRSLGVTPAAGTRLLVELGRCDTPRGTKERRCGAWGDTRSPRALELGP